MNKQSVYYIDNYAIITDIKLNTVRKILSESINFITSSIKEFYQVHCNEFGFSSLETAYDFASTRKWRNGVNIIAISDTDFDENGFVVAKILSDGKLDTMDDTLIEYSRSK